MASIKSRLYTYDDIQALSALFAASWKSAYRNIIHNEYLDDLSVDTWDPILRNGLQDKSLFSMVLEEDGKIIGASILGKTADVDTIELTSIYLHPNKIGQGYGTTFYAAIEKEAKRQGYRKCVLDVLAENTYAIRFYTRNGFKDDNETLKVKIGGSEYACILMSKQFAQ